MGKLRIALMHYPVYNKIGEVVTAAVVNSDIHDIARTAKTFGVDKYYIVTPLASQQEYVQKIMSHWTDGYGASYNPARKEAIAICEIKDDLPACAHDFAQQLIIVATSANFFGGALMSCEELRQMLVEETRDILLLFGTGWGLASDIISEADILLQPIKGYGEYNHLPVRAAVAIILARIVGDISVA